MISTERTGFVTKVCKVDFEIWDTVLARRSGWRLETMSRQQDKRDAAIMMAMAQNADREARNYFVLMMAGVEG